MGWGASSEWSARAQGSYIPATTAPLGTDGEPEPAPLSRGHQPVRGGAGPPLRAVVGGVPDTACTAVPLGGQGKGRLAGQLGVPCSGSPEGALPFPERPRHAHGAPGLARSQRPAEPRLLEKDRILPTEVTRCVRGMPPGAEAPPGPAARAPLTAGLARPLPAPWPHECLLRPKVLGNTTLGLRGRTRSRLRPGSAGPAAGGGSGLRRLARAAALGWGLRGAPSAAGTLPAGRSGGRPRAEQRRVSWASAWGDSRQICTFRASRTEGRGVGETGQ